MIKFLKKLRSELVEEKLKLEVEQNNLKSSIDRNHKFLQKLKEEVDDTYDVFSPRKKNVKLQDHIFSLEEEQDKLLQSINEIEKKLADLNLRLSELDHVLKKARVQEAENLRIESEKDLVFSGKDIKSLLQRIELCIMLFKVDPNRCLMELCATKKVLQEMQRRIGEGEDESN